MIAGAGSRPSAAAQALSTAVARCPRSRIGLVLGSGLGGFVEREATIDYAWSFDEIPGLVRATAPGHRGRILFARIGDVQTIIMQGRLHYYEGLTLSEVTAPIRLLAELGVETLILTGAVGGIRDDLLPGDLVVITDHINLLGDNPLRGPHDPNHGERFPDMSAVYDRQLANRAHAIAEELGISISNAIYVATTGPSFETPAEIRAFKTLGADVVGMSTVPDAIVARQLGMRVCGISCVTNKAAGLAPSPLTHSDITTTAQRIEADFARLIVRLVAHASDI